MAQLALIQIRHARKLPLMLILMAVRASRKLEPVQGVFALGNVATAALNLRMLELQGIGGTGVLFDAKSRRLETVDGVA